MKANAFVQAGAWNASPNWSRNVVPTANSTAVVQAAATIPSGCVAVAHNVYLEQGGSITIEDGGLLVHDNDGVSVTLLKEIIAYWNDEEGYYLVSSPLVDGITPASAGMTDNTYDLYAFCQDSVGEEWQNQKVETFSLERGKGYLYANSGATTLTYSGAVSGSAEAVSMTIFHEGDVATASRPRFVLVGNPFVCNATLNCSYYRLGDDGKTLVVSSDPIAPGEAVFVRATSDNATVTFTRIVQ